MSNARGRAARARCIIFSRKFTKSRAGALRGSHALILPRPKIQYRGYTSSQRQQQQQLDLQLDFWWEVSGYIDLQLCTSTHMCTHNFQTLLLKNIITSKTPHIFWMEHLWTNPPLDHALYLNLLCWCHPFLLYNTGGIVAIQLWHI